MSFGDKLKRERERQKISLDHVASVTKIGTRYLQAIEDEDLTRLPGGVFNRGFVRAYAQLLDLDPEELVRDLTDASQPRPLAPTADAETPARPRRLKWLGSSS